MPLCLYFYGARRAVTSPWCRSVTLTESRAAAIPGAATFVLESPYASATAPGHSFGGVSISAHCLAHGAAIVPRDYGGVFCRVRGRLGRNGMARMATRSRAMAGGAGIGFCGDDGGVRSDVVFACPPSTIRRKRENRKWETHAPKQRMRPDAAAERVSNFTFLFSIFTFPISLALDAND